jgi:hypothetical protein
MQLAQWVLDADDALLTELVELRHHGVTRQKLAPIPTPELTAIGRTLGFTGEPYEIALAALKYSLTRLSDKKETYAAHVYFGYVRVEDDDGPGARRLWVALRWAHQSLSIFRGPTGRERVLLTDILNVLRSKAATDEQLSLKLGFDPAPDNVGIDEDRIRAVVARIFDEEVQKHLLPGHRTQHKYVQPAQFLLARLPRIELDLPNTASDRTISKTDAPQPRCR